MKKHYIAPEMEVVNVRLKNSILGDPGMADWSNGVSELGAKKHGQLDFDEDDEGYVRPSSSGLWDD